VRACKAMVGVDLLPDDPTDDEIRGYIGRVSDSLGLPNPFEYSALNLNLDSPSLASPFVFESPSIGPNDHDEIKGDYIALLDWAARRLWKLRLSEPGLLLLHGQRFFRPERAKKARLLIGEEGTGWYTAPFGKTSEGRVGFSSRLKSPVPEQFMVSLGLYLSMHQMACQAGPFSMVGFPDIPKLRHRWEEVKEAVNAIMQYHIW
jgi:hypothetical protein